jgi:hypothetical protein
MASDGGETISGMDPGRPSECDKKCHTVKSVGIPFYNVAVGIKDAALRRGRCRIIPKREAFSK